MKYDQSMVNGIDYKIMCSVEGDVIHLEKSWFSGDKEPQRWSEKLTKRELKRKDLPWIERKADKLLEQKGYPEDTKKRLFTKFGFEIIHVSVIEDGHEKEVGSFDQTTPCNWINLRTDPPK